MTPRHKIVGSFSSYDRGLDLLVFKIWPEIKAKEPDAELHVAYGWDLFDAFNANNPERLGWKKRVVDKMKELGVIDHGRLSKEELQKLQKKCGLWLYPCYFAGEIFCITALDVQREGMVPVATDDFGLSETVKSGTKISGDVYDPDTQQDFIKTTLTYMADEALWQKESNRAKQEVQGCYWEDISKAWIDVIEA